MSHGEKTTMSNRQGGVGPFMRPNIQISHALNGRVKDFAAANDLDASEAYRMIIETGLEELQGRHELPDLEDA